MAEVTKTLIDDLLAINIDGIPHLIIDFKDCPAIHSYIDDGPPKNKPEDIRYYIEFYLASGQTIKCEYVEREVWETILKGL